jgi:hypothetical protein
VREVEPPRSTARAIAAIRRKQLPNKRKRIGVPILSCGLVLRLQCTCGL